MTGPYDAAVFSGTFLIAEFVRIGAITSLYCLAILGWGDLVWRAFAESESDFLDYIVTRLVIGCFGLYAAFMFLSAGGFLDRRLVAFTLAVGVVLGLFRLRVFAKKLSETFRKTLHWSFEQRLLFGFVFVLAALQVACGFTPLTFYDAQVYQLLAPVQFLSGGGLVHIPWNVYSNAPMALQLTLGMSWIADATGNTFKLLMTLFGCLMLLAAARIGGEFGLRAALVAALFVATYPEFWIHQTFGVVDLAVASFSIFGAIWWVEALRLQSWNRVLRAGVAFGFVVASRYQGVVLVAWMLLGVLVNECLRNHKIVRRALLKSVVAGAVIVVMVGPWLIGNYSHFGNPVFPLLHEWLGGAEWSADQAVRLQAEVMGASLLEIPAPQIVMAPVNALLMLPSNGLFGLGLLLGSLIVSWAGGGNIRIYAVLGLGGLIIWGLIHPIPGVQLLRFNAATLVLLLACTGALLGSDRFQEWKGVYVAATLALGSLLIAIVTLNGVVPVWQTLTSATARNRFWQANVPSWQVLAFANEKLDPARHKILLIGETRALWLRIPFLAPSSFNGPQLYDIFAANADAKAWAGRLHQLGITHILISSSEWQRLADGYGYFRLADEHLSRFRAWISRLPVLFDDHRGNLLISLS
ncbi:MAG: hypothetical protein DMG13_08495 [Acidobacteria bacterium]|nr:MAG: hypothetical protein DMG13_08495 [Acidobacteriota bacterium]